MDVIQRLSAAAKKPISCIEMHTTGEPTRIIYEGYPELSGTLLQQRAEAKQKYDHIRERLLLEPRGHYDMYGALLRPDTELTRSGEAHMGVLFMTNDGYSTMCGHATIALGRFLLDTHDPNVFPRRNEIKYDRRKGTAILNLHAPCGLLQVTVPVKGDGSHSDPERSVTFLSVPSFATGLTVSISIPDELRWPELAPESKEVCAGFAYGGAFFCLVEATELGFPEGLKGVKMEALSHVAKCLKTAITANSELAQYYEHPEEPRMSFLYSIIVVDDLVGGGVAKPGSELGVCYFADQQIDRSPTGSGVAARVAHAYYTSSRDKEQPYTYHSLVSRLDLGPGFVGTIVEDLNPGKGLPGSTLSPVRVEVGGKAYYTGFSTFSVEKEDPLGDSGFAFMRLPT